LHEHTSKVEFSAWSFVYRSNLAASGEALNHAIFKFGGNASKCLTAETFGNRQGFIEKTQKFHSVLK
jgi:hypothetical protein